MADEAQHGRFIVVKWESKLDIDNERLATFVDINTHERPIIVTGNIKKVALLIFKTEKGTDILQHQWLKPDFWKILKISVVHESTSLWITNMPPKCEEKELYMFFTNSVSLDNLRLDAPTVDRDYFSPEDGVAVIHLKTLKDLNDACKKQGQFKKLKEYQLKLTPFYKDIYGVQKPIDETPHTIATGIDETKLMYMKEFWNEEIEQEIQSLFCTKITWPKDPTFCKVKLIFDCHHDDHRSQRGKKWKVDVENTFRDYMKQIKIDARVVDDEIKSEVNRIVEEYTGTNVCVENIENDNKLLLIGRDNEEEWLGLQKLLDSVQPPVPKETKIVSLESNRPRIMAFEDMGLKNTMDFRSVVVEVDAAACKISITGNATEVPDAERTVHRLLAQMCEHEVNFPNKDYRTILMTHQMKDKIDICIRKRGTRCAFVSTGDKLVLFSMDSKELMDMEKDVINLIAKHDIKLEGTINQNKELFDRKVKTIEEGLAPNVCLHHQVGKSDVKITIICDLDILRDVIPKIDNELSALLVRQEELRISDYIFNYIEKKTLLDIKREIKQARLNNNILRSDSTLRCFIVEGVEEDRKKVVAIVKKYAHSIHASWRNLKGETIEQYCYGSDFQTFLRETIKTHSCDFIIATKHHLKERLIHCVAIMKTGQAIFVGNASCDSLEEFDEEIEVVVSTANSDLQPGNKGLARDLVNKGGDIIQYQCDAYVKLHGPLSPSEVFVSTAGKLHCKKIIHAVGPVWQGGQGNEEQQLSDTLEKVLTVMNDDSEFILRSMAIPLIGHGQGKFAAKRSARVMLRTLKNKLADYPNVREIYFLDFDPKTVRTVQKEMHAQFGDRCFHTPVENVGIGKGTVVSTKPGMFCLRSGTRRIPLPGGKLLCIKWGKLHDTGTEIVVSPTPTAPQPSGQIINALSAKSAHFDLKSECTKEFKKLNKPTVDNGTIVQTVGPIGSIYHLKIEQKWDQGKGPQNLEDYTKACLSRAILNKIKFMALPPIGVADNSYPAVDVAKTMIRSVAQFVKNKPKCSLEEISIVIHDSDMATTSAFEHVMGELFSKRPHRLDANIQDSVQKEEKSTPSGSNNAAKAVNTPPPTYLPNTPRIYQVSKNATVQLVKGSLELATTDVIVCTTSSFPRLNGAIVNALQRAGGPSLQRELLNQYKSYPGNGVPASGGGMLKCKHVFYSQLEQYDPKKKGPHWEVTQCLQRAENENMSSIAFPTFGTGNFGYPAKFSADQMFGAIKTFFQTTRHNLNTVVIFLYAPDTDTSQVFESHIGTYFNPYVQPKGEAKPDKQEGNTDTPFKVNFKASIVTTFGNLEESKTDVILDTTTSFPTLNGIIPQNLLKAAGAELLAECNTIGKASENAIVKTKAYKLKCQNIYHFVMPLWNQAKGETYICDCIFNCLMMMKDDGLTSIAVPAIGCGGAKYDPTTVAKGICSAVAKFGSANPGYACVVTVVFYPGGPQESNTTIKSVIDKWTADKNTESGPPKPKKAVNFTLPVQDDEDDDDVTFEVPKDTREFLLLKFMSDKTENVDTAFQAINERIDKDRKEIVVPLENKDNVDDVALIENDKKSIDDFGRIFKVSLEIDLKRRKITISGLGDTVTKCYKKVLEELRERRKMIISKDIGMTLQKHVEWYYTEDKGDIWIPYTRDLSYVLEEAYEFGADLKAFKDSNKKTYEVNFKKWNEVAEGDTKNETVVSVIRKNFTEGMGEVFPRSWAFMPEGENLTEVLLDKSDQEYKDVEAEFLKTLGTYLLSQIKQIRRVQNKSLYQQYQTKKKQLETALPNQPNIERDLFNGYDEKNEKSILQYGFNRSYSGATFGGVYFGYGVYFAVKSEYSANDVYSVPDAQGLKRMFLVKVLTGNTVAVPKGYSDRYPPLIQGSQTERHNSVCDNELNPTEFVIFNDIQAYPEYVIVFK